MASLDWSQCPAVESIPGKNAASSTRCSRRTSCLGFACMISGTPARRFCWPRGSTRKSFRSCSVIRPCSSHSPAARPSAQGTRRRPPRRSSASAGRNWGQNWGQIGGKCGEPNVRQLEPDPRLAETPGGAPGRGVKLILRRFRCRQAQEHENGAVERLHFFGGQ